MKLLAKILDYRPNITLILDWPDGLDYKFISNLKYGEIDIIGTIDLFDLNQKHFEVWKPQDLFMKYIRLSNVMNFNDYNNKIYYETIERIPKDFFEYILPKLILSNSINITILERLQYLKDNLDKIYDELMIKDIIE